MSPWKRKWTVRGRMSQWPWWQKLIAGCACVIGGLVVLLSLRESYRGRVGLREYLPQVRQSAVAQDGAATPWKADEGALKSALEESLAAAEAAEVKDGSTSQPATQSSGHGLQTNKLKEESRP